MIKSTLIEMGYCNPNRAWEYRVLGWGLLLKSVSKWSYVSVDNWLPLEESIMPRRWLGRDEAFLGKVPGERQLALSAPELGLFLTLQTRTRGVVLKPKGTLLSFPSTSRVRLSSGDSKSVSSALMESLVHCQAESYSFHSPLKYY